MIHLLYDKGSITIRGDVATPYGHWDPRINAYRAIALYYEEIKSFLDNSGISYKDDVPALMPIPSLRCTVSLRPYQEDALKAWTNAGKRGVIVLPTGAGKTFIAIKAIEILNQPTLIIVPTIDLIDQWKKHLVRQFNVDVGVVGGGEERIKALTVSTYDSAVIRAEQLGNVFMFLIFDEVHHLPAPTYSQIAEMYIAPYRMGLTATYEREDDAHRNLPRLMGGKVFEVDVDSLTGKHLSPYTYEKVWVELTLQEKEDYVREYAVFTNYLRSRGIKLRSPNDFQRFIMMTGRDPEARKALLARNRALRIVLNSEAKIEALGKYLSSNRDEKSLIFTRYNALVYTISRRFLIPAITHLTQKEERREVLEKFRTGFYRAIVTSQVLDEGIDVPDASVGFILGGTGSSREYIQRLGRILRKKEGKEAKLIEFVAKETVETRISQRRHGS
ncbi:MAG: DEAD/DEAH box helicase family protein [Candidatus Bathyarchaeota archaeon]